MRYLGALLPAATATAAMVGVLLVLKTWLPGWTPIERLAVEVPAGGVIYGAVLFTIFRKRVLRYVRFVLELRKSPESGGSGLVNV
jgi:hypothetical protein